ncbi:phospholipase D-like domain-containing protein [Nitrosophilus kaiyonis]|uniref:phospholipase D-like domain-containing protein n=1 Tax=Nitrosophilus kaiyonis TaxID=2930200 RepID=UPI0024903FE7|nr:phospholipase D-like domain-containing protein [Nitrosophilus kaiyonis]
MKKILLIFVLAITLFGKNLYFMPYESKKALNHLLKSIDLAKNKIDILIFSFTNEVIAKRLKNAAKRGVKIRIIFDEKTNLKDRYSQIGYLAKYKNIYLYYIKGKPYKDKNSFGKMHIKLMIIDNKKIVLGSANYSYSAFYKNYEILYFDDDLRLAKKSEIYFDRILKEAEEY